MNLESILTFGKHKGEQIEDLIEDNPGYVRWLMENTDIVFDNEVYEKLGSKG